MQKCINKAVRRLTCRNSPICSNSSLKCSIFLLIVKLGSVELYSWRLPRVKAENIWNGGCPEFQIKQWNGQTKLSSWKYFLEVALTNNEYTTCQNMFSCGVTMIHYIEAKNLCISPVFRRKSCSHCYVTQLYCVFSWYCTHFPITHADLSSIPGLQQNILSLLLCLCTPLTHSD